MSILEKIKNTSYEHKYFITFLFVHFIVWTSVGMIRTVLPTDALEGIYWGGLHDFGTPKHPPLAGWITYLVYILFKSDLSIYVVSQAFIIGGFYYIYKLGKIFLDDKRAILSVILLEGCWVYSYITGYYGFNPDVVLLFLMPLLNYIFLQCMIKNRNTDWIKLGIVVGISFLSKYQTVLILIPMFIWALIYKRDVFKNKMFYISVVIAYLIFAPHLHWMIKYDFFPLRYFEGELSGLGFIKHIQAPVMFLVMELVAVAGTLLMFISLKLRQKSSFKLIENLNNEKSFLILLFVFCPVVLLTLMVAFGGAMRFRWGFEFMYLTGIMLFYFFPTKEISKEDFKFVLKFAYIVMLMIFLVLGGLLSIEKNYRSRYPVAQIYSDMEKIWRQNQNTPLKYFGGYIEWTLPLTIYGKDHQQIILDTNGYKNPWIDESDLKKSGIIVIGRDKEHVYDDTKRSCPYLNESYEIMPIPYSFKVKNAFGQERQYDIFYHVVPPMK